MTLAYPRFSKFFTLPIQLELLLGSHLTACPSRPWARVEVATCRATHAAAMTPARRGHGRFLLLGAFGVRFLGGGVVYLGFFSLLFPSFPPKGPADPRRVLRRACLALAVGQNVPSRSSSRLQPWSVEVIPSSFAQKSSRTLARWVEWRARAFRPPLPSPYGCAHHAGPRASPNPTAARVAPKGLLRFGSSLFGPENLKAHSCNGAPLKAKASQRFRLAVRSSVTAFSALMFYGI